MQHVNNESANTSASPAHVRGPQDAALAIVEYGDFQCPYCARAHQVLGELAREFSDKAGGIRLEFRHLPLSALHPLAQLAAEAAEAAAAQGQFWQMHDLLYENQQDTSGPQDLADLADNLGLDAKRFGEDLHARNDGAHQTPTFIINGTHYRGDSDYESLAQAFSEALGR